MNCCLFCLSLVKSMRLDDITFNACSRDIVHKRICFADCPRLSCLIYGNFKSDGGNNGNNFAGSSLYNVNMSIFRGVSIIWDFQWYLKQTCIMYWNNVPNNGSASKVIRQILTHCGIFKRNSGFCVHRSANLKESSLLNLFVHGSPAAHPWLANYLPGSQNHSAQKSIWRVWYWKQRFAPTVSLWIPSDTHALVMSQCVVKCSDWTMTMLG